LKLFSVVGIGKSKLPFNFENFLIRNSRVMGL